MRYLLLFSILLASFSLSAQVENRPGEPLRGKATRDRTKIQYEERSQDKLPGQARHGRPYREGTKIIYR